MSLRVSGLDVFYGAIHAIKGLDLEVGSGEIVTLIGANGAGKSTTLNTISGLVRARVGAINWNHTDIHKLAPHEIVKLGVSQAPEGRRIFAPLTVRENLELGAYCLTDASRRRTNLDRVLGLFPRLKERLNQYGGTLSGGEQQMLAIGRALMADPQMLLLDEPSLGLAPFLVQEIFGIIKSINAEGTAILLVEQNAHMALSVASRGYVLETGKVVLSGRAEDLSNNEAVRKAYLGE